MEVNILASFIVIIYTAGGNCCCFFGHVSLSSCQTKQQRSQLTTFLIVGDANFNKGRR